MYFVISHMGISFANALLKEHTCTDVGMGKAWLNNFTGKIE